MSRIAKNSIKFTKDTNCSFENGLFTAKGKLGEISLNVNPLYIVEIKEEELFVNPVNEKHKTNLYAFHSSLLQTQIKLVLKF